MSITRDFKLSLVAGRSIPLVINANQYDQDETWRFTLLDENGQKYSPSTGSIIGLKSDGHIIANAGTVSSTGLVIIAETEQMTASPGKNFYELLIDDETHGTANFVVFVEPRPGAGGTPSDSDLAVFQEAIDAAAQIGDASELVDDVAVLKSRMDEFTTLTDGSTTGDAELADIRVGADGTIYPNAGDAVRGQVSDLKNAISDLANYNYIEPVINWTYGQVKQDGTLGTSSSYMHSQLIPVNEGDLIEWQVNAGTSMMMPLYETENSNANVNYCTGGTETLVKGTLEVPNGFNFIRISSLTSAKDDAYLRIYSKSEKTIEKSNDFFDGTGEKMGYVLRPGYIKANGEIGSGSFKYTLPISVSEGEKYTVTTQGSSAVSVIALYDSNGFSSEDSIVGNDSLSTYNITIPEGITGMSVSCPYTQLSNMKILRKGTTISELIPSDTITDKTVNLLIKRNSSLTSAEHRCATINFQFDDGNAKDADIVNIFKGKNAVCGFALISNISSSRVDEYLGYQEDGFEMLSHSTDSEGMADSTVSSATIEGKLKDSKKVLTGYGFDIRGWVTPRSAMASAFIPLLSKYYDFAYTQYFGEYTGTGTPWFTKTAELNKLSRVSVQGTTLANMKLAVDNAIANNGFLTFYGHSANLDTTDYETTENLEELLDYINTKQADLQCKLLSPSDAVDFYFHVRHEDYLELLGN